MPAADWRVHRLWGLKQPGDLIGNLWAVAGVASATAVFWLFRHHLDKGQASLLYLPVVIACAVRFGFTPAVLGAMLSFFCWNFFFLPPVGTFVVSDPRDWLSLVVFLVAAITTAHLASRVRQEAREAEARERETASLYKASLAISSETDASRILPTLAQELVQASGASRCVIFRHPAGDGAALNIDAVFASEPFPELERAQSARIARLAAEHSWTIGLTGSRHLWQRGLEEAGESMPDALGLYIPLRAQGRLEGVLHVGQRRDRQPFSVQDERLILALANNAATVIARQAYVDDAAQASALREADVLKDSLLSMVSHELRSPLAAIKATTTGLLQDDSRDLSTDDTALLAINVEADRLASLVGNLLDLSRLEAGAWIPDKDWCDLAEIAGTSLDRLPEADAERARLDVDLKTPLVKADYTQIALVLTNLLENAAKYAPDTAPIDLNIVPAYNGIDESPSGATVVVRDYGPGIAPGDEERIFERFFRSEAQRRAAIRGTGLGLALCRAVASAHGGRIWAANASDPPGAVFTLLLPVDSPG